MVFLIVPNRKGCLHLRCYPRSVWIGFLMVACGRSVSVSIQVQLT